MPKKISGLEENMRSHEDSGFQTNSSLYNEDPSAFHEEDEEDNETYFYGLDDKEDTRSLNPSQEKILDKIINVKSIRGHVQKLLYTHNTSANGLLGILSTERMIATVEENVNFRYGIDSRYSGGVTLIMENEFHKKYANLIYHDLYNQKKHLMNVSKPILRSKNETDMSKLLSYINSITDFRCIQMSGKTGKLKSIEHMVSKKEKKEKFRKRYQMSLVNPQIRIPWSCNAINTNDIELILVAHPIDTEIMHGDYPEKIEKNFKTFSTIIRKQAGDAETQSVRSEIVRNLNMVKGESAVFQYKKLRQQGKIKVIDTGDENLYSHQAGRSVQRGLAADTALYEAAKIGLEIDMAFYGEAMNNSPSALSMYALTQFEKAYFLHLYGKGYMME